MSEPQQPDFRMCGPLATAGFLIVELAFLAAAHIFGGPPWTLLAMIALLAQIATDLRLGPLALLVPSLAWLALHRVTGDRELFFPFAMYLATFVALLAAARGTWRGLLAGGIVVAAFLAIRWLQDASPRVLAVEAAVALVILAVAVTAYAASGKRDAVAPAILFLASLAAYASLAL
jgi:hypothetical protein